MGCECNACDVIRVWSGCGWGVEGESITQMTSSGYVASATCNRYVRMGGVGGMEVCMMEWAVCDSVGGL